MKSILDKERRDELIQRISQLQENKPAQWGKMNIYQMLKHCTLWEEMAFGRKKYKRVFIGRLFGRMALKNVLKDERPLMRNTPTLSALRITENGDVEAEKKKWISLMEEYAHFPDTGIMHPFFGKMTREQIGQLSFKHTDHHLRQFNV